MTVPLPLGCTARSPAGTDAMIGTEPRRRGVDMGSPARHAIGSVCQRGPSSAWLCAGRERAAGNAAVRSATAWHMGEPPCCFGYLRLSDGLSDQEVGQMERIVRRLARLAGMHLISIFTDGQPGCYSALNDLMEEVRRTPIHHVIVPSLDHVSSHPLIQALLLDRLEGHGAQLWVIDPAGPGQVAIGSDGRSVASP